jgi:hypothetical protein
MHHDTMGMLVIPEIDRAEDLIPKLTYRQLVENLPQLAVAGVLEEGSLPMMLVVARLLDRRRMRESGMSSVDLKQGLEYFREASSGTPARAVESALLQAIDQAPPIIL